MSQSSNNAEPRVYTSTPSQHHGQFLMEEWSDGSKTIAWRGDQWETWTPAVELVAVPLHQAVTR